MAYTCPIHHKLVETGAEAAEELPVYWWKKTPLCPKCLSEGVAGKDDSFTVHKVEQA